MRSVRTRLAATLLAMACDNAGAPMDAADPRERGGAESTGIVSGANVAGSTSPAAQTDHRGAEARGAPASDDDRRDPAAADADPDLDAAADDTAAEDPAPPVLELRKTRRAMMIYPQPAPGEAFRGKLPAGEAFAVYEHVDGPECRGTWGRVSVAGFVCLDDTTVTEQTPTTLPRLPGQRLVPYHYAKLRDAETVAPVWRSRRAMKRGDEPIDQLEAEHVYAFVRRKRLRSGGYLSDKRRRAVASQGLKHLQPSTFAGRDLQAAPIPDGKVLAWTLQWPKTPIYEAPAREPREAGRRPFHAEIYVHDAPVRRGGVDYYPLADGSGYVSAKDHRRWSPPVTPLPAGLGDDEPWLDIELSQQVLTVMHGRTPVYATMISSGTWKDPTPTGIYRFEGKMALSDMRSRAGDDEVYHVEAVPWVMYFKGRYALHAAYWHDRFGRRTSHGCVNLSATDARRIYALTEPHAPDGWVMVFEHPQAPGTVVRIHKGDPDVEDKRKPLSG